MISLPVVLLIFISSNNRDGELLTMPSPEKNVDENPSNRLANPQEPNRLEKLTSRVNDLSLPNLKNIGEDVDEPNAGIQKNLMDPLLKAEKNTKRQEPMPMYSLVKNGCEEGYVIDQNGVCQKAVTIKNDQKKFDSERRRKRYIQDSEVTGQRKLKPFFEHYGKSFRDRILVETFKGNSQVKCELIYPGLVPDGSGGCRKADSLLEKPTRTYFPPSQPTFDQRLTRHLA